MEIFSRYEPNVEVWIPNIDRGWILAKILEKSVENNSLTLSLYTELDQYVSYTYQITPNVDPNLILPPLQNPSFMLELNALDNLANLTYLHEPAVFNGIELRFENEIIYTYSGIVLIAVNPFKKLDLYSVEIMREYSGKKRGELEPHLYAIAEDAYRNMLRDGKNQSIIVSGESGAGKTVAAKFVMRYFATIADLDLEEAGYAASKPKSNDAFFGVEEAVLSTNPIMESFGNAKTTRNDNSSRFGKYIEILFSKSTQGSVKITGAKIRTYLLERSRLVFQPATERNYHIFYQMCAGMPPAERKELGLGSWDTFFYLKQGGIGTVPDVDDAAEFVATQNAMSVIGLSVTKQWDIFRICAALLHIGNINIEGEKDAGEISDSDPSLNLACQLLKIDKSEFKKWLSKRQITIGRDKMEKPLPKEATVVARDSVAKFIYSQLFEWIVKVININLARDDDSKRSFIGVLDIFGFEHFEKNSFEQFCINYANEKLQQEFNRHVFKLEQDLYKNEGLVWTAIDFDDNQECIDLIEGKISILSILDEESRLPAGKDSSLIAKYYQFFAVPTQKYFVKPKFGSTSFTVKHYANDVTYEIEGFVEKNKDTVSDEQLGVLLNSTCEFLKEVVTTVPPTSGESASKGSGKPLARATTASKKPTLGSIFRSSLISLMDTIRSTEPHYIRCIKPNLDKVPGVIDAPMVLSQLRACGVVETLKISHKGYPSRYLYNEFAEMFYILIRSNLWTNDDKLLTERVVKETIKGDDLYQMGKTQIFFRSGQIANLDSLRSQKQEEVAILLQKHIRAAFERHTYQALKISILSLQALIRAANARKLYKLKKESKAALIIQSRVRGILARKYKVQIAQAAVTVQKLFHAKLAKAKYVKLLRERATIRIQAAWRRYIAQKELRRRISLILFIQSRVRRHEDRQTYFRLRAESKSAGKLKEINNALDAKIISLSAAMAAKNQELKEMEERIKVLEARSATDKLRMVVEAAKYKNRHKKETEALEKLKLEKLQSDENWKLIVKQKDDEIRKLNGEISKIKAESEKQIDDVKQNFEYVESIQRKNSAMSNSSNIQRRPTYLSANNSLLPKSNVTLPVTGNWIVPMIASPAGSDNGMEDEPQNNVTEIIANLKKENEALKAQMEKAIAGKWRGSVIPNNMRRGTLNRMNSLAPSKIGSPFASPSSPIGLGAPQVSNTMVSSPTASAPGSPSQRIFGQTIRESVETIAKVKKLETEILDSLIRNLRIPVPTINPKLKRKEILYPAHLMGNLILHLMMTGQVNGASQLISSIIREIRNTESVSEDGFIQAFWLSNTYELSINLQRAAHSPADGRRRTTFDEDVHLRVEVHLKDLDQLVHELYQAFVKTRRSQLSKLFIPGLIENQSLPNYYCRAGRNLAGNDSKIGKSALDELILVIQRSVNIMRGYHTDEGIVRQFAAEMTKFVGVSGFNNLLMRKNFCTWKRGVQIQYNVSRIEDWCIEQNFSQVLLPLQRLQQAAKLLTLNKSSVADLNVMIDVCNLLTLTQIKRLLSIFYAVEAFSNPSPDLLKALSVRIGLESQRNSDSLLLDLDYNADFVKPIGSGAIAKAETYVPPWVSVPTVSETLLAVS